MADYQLYQMQSDVGALREAGNRIATIGDSAGNTAQTVTVAAPGAGSRLHLTSLIGSYSDASDHVLSITLTQNGSTGTIKVSTGVQLILTDLSLAADENTAITIDAPAAGLGVTSHVVAETWIETL